MSKLLTKLIDNVENWERPNPLKLFLPIMFSYFIVTSGIVYDIINEPPAMGGRQDPVTGKVKPETFMAGRINGQYIIEGLTGGFFYVLGALALVGLDYANRKGYSAQHRLGVFAASAVLGVFAYSMTMLFLSIKMPNYMR